MPKNFNPKDVSILTRLGYVVIEDGIEDGVFKVTTAIAGHKPNDTISQDRAIELAEFLTPPMSELDRELVRVPSSSYISSKCEHGNESVSCMEGNCYYYYDDED